ncbi:MAG: hypothetical protein KBG07_07095 [Elusimicrobia bacterium]|nr:hypothetical protein [Elusimicrobiota bacterium]
MALGEDDAVSYSERLTPDGEEADRDVPSGFHGDLRLRMREVRPPGSTYQSAPTQLQHNLYFYQRARMLWGPVSGGGLIKRASVGPALSIDNLKEYGTLKGNVELKDVGLVRRLVAGNYTLVFGQGLLFYDGFGEFVRPIEVKNKGPRPDYSSGTNDYLRGGAARLGSEGWGLDVFVSDKPLDFSLNADGSVNANLDTLHDATGDVQTQKALDANNTVTERLVGARGAARWGSAEWGVSGYRLGYSRSFSPNDREFADARAFRGDGLTLTGTDVAIPLGSWKWVGELARSKVSGDEATGSMAAGWTSTVLWNGAGSHFWLGLFDYDPDFISPHGKGLSYGVSGGVESLPRNQKGGVWGGEWKRGPWSGRANITLARFPEAKGDGANSDPVAPSEGRYLLLDQRWTPDREWEFRVSFQERNEDKMVEEENVKRQVPETTQKWRAAVSWAPTSAVRWTVRRDERIERVSSGDEKAVGRLWLAEAVAQPWNKTRVKVRAYFFNSPEAYLTTGPEEIWDGVVYDRLAGNLGNLRGDPGTRIYLIAGQEWGPARFWGKIEMTQRAVPADGGADASTADRRAWHVQSDIRW